MVDVIVEFKLREDYDLQHAVGIAARLNEIYQANPDLLVMYRRKIQNGLAFQDKPAEGKFVTVRLKTNPLDPENLTLDQALHGDQACALERKPSVISGDRTVFDDCEMLARLYGRDVGQVRGEYLAAFARELIEPAKLYKNLILEFFLARLGDLAAPMRHH